MRNKAVTLKFYTEQLGFQSIAEADYEGYLILKREAIEIHFFEHKTLDPTENDGQVYIRTQGIDELYQSFIDHQVKIHPNSPLQIKPWGQKEFALLDPDHNLLTFGESI